jgi:hypothetical protein
MGIYNFWYAMMDKVQSMTAGLVIGICITGIIGILLLSILKIQKQNTILAIIVPAIVSCFLMVPFISSFNYIVDKQVGGGIIDEAKAEIKAQRVEASRLKAENMVKILEREKLDNQITISKQTLEIQALNDNIKLLENTQLSMQSFQKILQVALLQTNIKQTMVRKDDLNPRQQGWGLLADFYNDEILVILTHDINAKFGVDLTEIKVVKLDGNNVIVSGIRPKYIGSDRNKTDEILKEVRRVNYKRGEVASVRVENSAQNLNLADRYAKTYEDQFQTKLSEGLELGFMNDAVVQLAQNFITVMLAPLYRNIRFTDTEQPGALPLMQHVQKELEENYNRKIELLDINENLLAVNQKVDKEVAEIENENNLLEARLIDIVLECGENNE